MKKRHWWIPLFVVIVTGGAGLAWMATRTYQDAPPMARFEGPDGAVLFDEEKILAGQAVFLQRALMEYGSYFGDGSGRGPDFTADALRRRAQYMRAYYARESGVDEDVVALRVQREIKNNTLDAERNVVTLSAADVHAYGIYAGHVAWFFTDEGDGGFEPAGYITDERELSDLAAFFYWGAWVCGARRPGYDYSYTHNWPFDPEAGNQPSAPTTLWSVIGILGFILGVGFVLYGYGRAGRTAGWDVSDKSDVLTDDGVAKSTPTPTQRAAYPFMAVASVLFLVQVLFGALVAHDFLGATVFFGIDIAVWLPVTITRSLHLALALFWISACWMGASIFLLPKISGEEPPKQMLLVRSLFWLVIVLVVGSLVGIVLGPKGVMQGYWRMLGHQGWEFVEFGRAWQGLLFVAIALWLLILYRGAKPAIRRMGPLSLPWLLVFTVCSVLVLFISGFISGPKTNFVIADFWRWAVIHMWVEGFFEVFTTVIVAFFLVFMGLVSKQRAVRACYIATLLFLGSGLLGIAHNFYWNAKPVSMLALGSVFSTLQVLPLILLTLDAWKFRRMPARALATAKNPGNRARFGQDVAFLFLIGVNFWNFLGAGVFGLIINLPIVNYYEHGTYLTVNHGHAALMGVYGNLAIGVSLFCARFLLPEGKWGAGTLRSSFWALNIGLMLMLLLDTLPVGLVQLGVVLEDGYASARSADFIGGSTFQTLTWMRAVGGWIFTFGGVVPIAWFMISRWKHVKGARPEVVVDRSFAGSAAQPEGSPAQ